jgi:hypothetical protein
MWRMHLRELSQHSAADGSSRTQATLHELWRLPDPDIGVASTVQHAARAAAADFWCRIQDFASLQPSPAHWPAAACLGPAHPFINKLTVHGSADNADRICVRAPDVLIV